MSAVPCFTCNFVRNALHIQSGIELINGMLTLGEGFAQTKFDSIYFLNFMRNVSVMRLRRICNENIRSLPKTISSKGVLALIKTAQFGTPSTLPGYSRSFKRHPMEIISGRSLKYNSGSSPIAYTDSLWFMMPGDEVLAVEQGNTSHSGFVLSWNEEKLIYEKISRNYFNNDSE